jgi:hypothetical protein
MANTQGWLWFAKLDRACTLDRVLLSPDGSKVYSCAVGDAISDRRPRRFADFRSWVRRLTNLERRWLPRASIRFTYCRHFGDGLLPATPNLAFHRWTPPTSTIKASTCDPSPDIAILSKQSFVFLYIPPFTTVPGFIFEPVINRPPSLSD